MFQEHAHRRLRTTDRMPDVEDRALVGTDNTTFTMCKALAYLHRYPEWFAKMQAEQYCLRSEHGETMNRHVRICYSPSQYIAIEGDLVVSTITYSRLVCCCWCCSAPPLELRRVLSRSQCELAICLSHRVSLRPGEVKWNEVNCW